MFIVSLWSVSFGVSVGLSALRSQQPQDNSCEHHYEPDNGSSAATGADKSDNRSAQIQHGEQKESSKWSDPITWFTFGLLLVGVCQCLIYWRQKEIMVLSSRALELAERAELQILNLALPPTTRFERITRLEITIKNFGRTVATDVISNVRFHDMESATAATTPCIVAPGATNTFPYLITDINGPLSDEEFLSFTSGHKVFKIVVEVSFTDIFDKRVTTVYDIFWDIKDRGFKFTSVRRK
jgi:hypothetical protein